MARREYGRDGAPVLRGARGLLSPGIRLQGGSIEGAPAWVLEQLGPDPVCGVCCSEPAKHFRIPRAFEGVIAYCGACVALVGIEGEEP